MAWWKEWLKSDWKESRITGQDGGCLFMSWFFGQQAILSALALSLVLQMHLKKDEKGLINSRIKYATRHTWFANLPRLPRNQKTSNILLASMIRSPACDGKVLVT